MEILKVFDENIKNEFLNSPLNHPNISYDWYSKRINLENKSYEIIYIGKLIDDGSIEVINFNNAELGFIDENKNIVTHILFHPLNLRKPGYKNLYDAIKQSLKMDKEEPEQTISKDIHEMINCLDEDVPFYMDLLKYIRTNNFDFPSDIPYKKNDIDNLINFVQLEKATIIKEFPHLKLMMNILENKAV